MKRVVLVGAGGKMGMRLTHNLRNSNYHMSYLEVSNAGLEKLQGIGIKVSKKEDVVNQADVVIYAVPDVALDKVTAELVPFMRPGAMAVTLDPAAALAGKLFPRPDITYFVSHPSHPSIFNWEPTPEAQRDFFGGVSAKQTIVCALMQGPEADYEAGVEIASTFYAPVSKAYRITVEQMGILEPALVETLCSTCIYVVRQALDEVIKLGVPKDAATDFLLGHLNIQLAVLFDQIPGAVFSDAANKALQRGLKQFIKEDWKKVFDPEDVKDQIRSIT